MSLRLSRKFCNFQRKSEKIHIQNADAPPAAGRVTIHAYTMPRNSDQLTASSDLFRPYIQPTNTTLPTLQCVVEIGTPNLLAMSTVAAAPFSMTNPLFVRNAKLNRKN